MDPNALVRNLREMVKSRDPIQMGLMKLTLEDYGTWLDMGGFPTTEEAWR